MFPCTNCGLCCQNISSVYELKEFDLGNGICKYFDNMSNNCSIYDIRPNICRIDKMYDIQYKKILQKKIFIMKMQRFVMNYKQNTNLIIVLK